MKILYVTSEAAPFAKTGGLGDVAGSLPAALNAKRAYTRVMMPLYECIGQSWREQMTFLKYTYITLGWRRLYCGIFELKHGGVTYYFLDNEYYFKRPNAYGYFDDGERFAFFSRAVTEVLGELDWGPDIVHLNDWQTALVPVYMKELAGLYPRLAEIKSVFTIHNIEYQGQFSGDIVEDVLGLPRSWYDGGVLKFRDSLSLMKGALLKSDYITTVSPTYAEELRYGFFAQGLEGDIGAISDHFRGILNGIDMEAYNPETDELICHRYSVETRTRRKKNKKALQEILGLKQDDGTMLVAFIGRLVAHKGIDLVLAAFDRMMEHNVQFIALGTGDYNYEQFFRTIEGHYPGRVSANITFSEELARRIYAGSDLFLMPSQKEPCGLGQMIAMRYGAVPLVRETGGLKDTVTPYNPVEGSGKGFTFANYTANDFFHVFQLAHEVFTEDKKAWDGIVERGMREDFSWGASAAEYKKLYFELCGKR